MFNSKVISMDAGLLVLRLASGLFMLFSHGLPKLMKFDKLSDDFADPIGVGPLFSLILILVAEVVCAAMVALGLFTRAATVVLIIAMGVAAFVVHGNDPFGDKEFALLYLAAYLTLFFTGAGRYSLHRVTFR